MSKGDTPARHLRTRDVNRLPHRYIHPLAQNIGGVTKAMGEYIYGGWLYDAPRDNCSAC